MFPLNVQVEDIILSFPKQLISYYQRQFPNEDYPTPLQSIFKNQTILLDFTKNNIFSLFISCLQKLNKHEEKSYPLILKQIELLSNIQMAQFFQLSEVFCINEISEISAKEMAQRIEGMTQQEMEIIFGPEDDFDEKDMITNCLNVWSE